MKLASILNKIAFLTHSLEERPLLVAITDNRELLTSFLDTGSPVSIIDERTYKTYFSSFPITQTEASLQGLGKGDLECLGEANIVFYLGKTRIRDSFVIVRNIDLFPVMLLGHALMRRHRIIWDPSQELAWVNGKKVRKSHTLGAAGNNVRTPVSNRNVMCEKVNEKGELRDDFVISSVVENKLVNMTLATDTEIPPGSSMLIKVKVRHKFANRDFMVENASNNMSNIMLTDSIVSSDVNGVCLLEVKNVSSKSLN